MFIFYEEKKCTDDYVLQMQNNWDKVLHGSVYIWNILTKMLITASGILNLHEFEQFRYCAKLRLFTVIPQGITLQLGITKTSLTPSPACKQPLHIKQQVYMLS